MTGLTLEEYERTFERVNLLQKFPGAIQNGDSFPVAKAKIAAQVVERMARERTIIFVGRNVSRAFGYCNKSLPFFELNVNRVHGYRFVCVPHTSGRNHWYNRPENLVQATQWWGEFIAGLQRSVHAVGL